MSRRTSLFAIQAVACTLLFTPNLWAKGRGNDKPLGTVYVTSQGLYYDTFKTTDLPPKGRFQQLYTDTPMGPSTDFGPGESGYVGGRWWVDTNNDGVMDELDTYFSCPLLGPGREEP